MSSVNKIILVGRLTADPDIKLTTTGLTVAKFNLAVERPDATKTTPQVDYIPVVAWRELADTTQGCQKGTLVLVEGNILTRSYDTEAGQRRWGTEVEARELKVLDKTGGNAAPYQTESFQSEPAKPVSSLEKHPSASENVDFNFGDDVFASEEYPPKFGDDEIGEDVPF